MMTTIAALLARWGLSERIAKMLAPVAAVAAAIALLAALWGVWGVFDWFNDRAAVQADRIESNLKARELQLEAAEEAARERLRNGATNAETKEALTDAIREPEPGDHDDPGIRLACEQLRRSGQNTADIPECGGR